MAVTLLAEVATFAVLLAVLLGIAASVLVCARPRPCRRCRGLGRHYRAGAR
jgi:hypothetical protein